MTELTAKELAEACAKSMWENDRCSKALGFTIVDVDAGTATLTMTVREDMLNGQNICHGGIMFTLADSAFAFACNAYNHFTVAQHCNVSFLRPVFEHDVLTAVAQERWRAGRSGIYDVQVLRGDEVVAEFRGHSRVVDGKHLPESS